MPDVEAPAHQTEVVARRQARALLDRILDGLDEEKREVFVLFELEQWTMQDIAQAVGCPVQTAHARLYAAREKVNEAIRAAQAKGGAS